MSSKSSQIICLVALSAVVASAQTLTYSNGPLITHPGAGLAGADASALETGGTVFGFTAGPANFRQADDFVVPCNEQWAIVGFRAFAYQTNSGIVSTLTSSNYRIWSGQPGTPGAVVIHDFSATNQQTATAFTNIYRVSGETQIDTFRPPSTIDDPVLAIRVNAVTIAQPSPEVLPLLRSPGMAPILDARDCRPRI